MEILLQENMTDQYDKKELFILSPNLKMIYDGIIYHYAPASILPNILHTHDNKICIRFTDYRFLNDISEGIDTQRIFDEIVDSLFEIGDISKELYAEIKIQNNIFNNTKNNLYVACFSKDRDSLPLWNYYLKENKYNGYSLGFDFENTLDSRGIIKRKVLYNDYEKRSAISSNIKTMIEDTTLFDPSDVEYKSKCLIKYLKKCLLIMKNECFSHENEIRLILDLDLITGKEKDYQCSEIKYFERNGIFIPYCDVTWEDKSIFKEICCAPTMNPEQTELGLKSLLHSIGYNESDYKIYNSNIPVRY